MKYSIIQEKLYAKEFVITPETLLKQVNDQQGIEISFFENKLPPGIAKEIDFLYGSLYSSLGKLKLDGRLDGASTYIARKGGKAVAIFLFNIDKGRVQVLNEVIKVNEAEIRRFSKAIFASFKHASAISLTAVESDIEKLQFPYQKYNFSENVVISLPETADQYLKNLGNATRRNVKYYNNKLRRNFPSFQYHFYESSEVTEQNIAEIIRLKLVRIEEKNKARTTETLNVKEILHLVKVCNGLVGVATIDGQVCGGQISYRIGNNDIASIIAHDSQYNDYSLGMSLVYLTICESIKRGGKEFNFLWGREEYKYRFLGRQRDFDNINIYRSKRFLIAHHRLALSSLWNAYLRRARFWLVDPKRREKFFARFTIKSARYLRNFNRFKIF